MPASLSWVKWDGHPTSFSDTNPSLQYVAAIPISLGCPKMFSVSRVQFWATCKRPSSSSSPWTSDPCWVNLFLAEHLTKWAHTHRKGDCFFLRLGHAFFLAPHFWLTHLKNSPVFDYYLARHGKQMEWYTCIAYPISRLQFITPNCCVMTHHIWKFS